MKLTIKIIIGICFTILVLGAFSQDSKIDQLEKRVAKLEKQVFSLEQKMNDKKLRIIPSQTGRETK